MYKLSICKQLLKYIHTIKDAYIKALEGFDFFTGDWRIYQQSAKSEARIAFRLNQQQLQELRAVAEVTSQALDFEDFAKHACKAWGIEPPYFGEPCFDVLCRIREKQFLEDPTQKKEITKHIHKVRATGVANKNDILRFRLGRVRHEVPICVGESCNAIAQYLIQLLHGRPAVLIAGYEAELIRGWVEPGLETTWLFISYFSEKRLDLEFRFLERTQGINFEEVGNAEIGAIHDRHFE